MTTGSSTTQGGQSRCTMYQVASLFSAADGRVATIEKTSNSFKDVGIFTFDANVFTDEDFAPSQVTNRPPGGGVRLQRLLSPKPHIVGLLMKPAISILGQNGIMHGYDVE